jgi:hypothetical protein
MPRSGHVGFGVDIAALVQVFSEYFGFPLPSIPPIAPQSSSSIIIWGWYNRSVVASVIVDLVPLHPRKGKKKKKKTLFLSNITLN